MLPFVVVVVFVLHDSPVFLVRGKYTFANTVEPR